MSLNSTVARLLAEKGLSALDIVEVMEALEATQEETRSPAAVRQSRYRARGGGKIPETMRQEVFERDGWVCLDCGSDQYLCADHIVPVSKGGETSFDNLQTLCLPCNSRKKDRIRKRDVRRKEANFSGGMSGGMSTDKPLNEYISKPPPSETKVSSGRERSAREKIVIPDWIPATAWAGWIEMRRLKHAKPSPHAIRLAIGELEKLRRDGHDPGAVLDQSTLKNWTGLFPIKEKSNGKQSDSDGAGRTGRAMLAVENIFRQAGHH